MSYQVIARKWRPQTFDEVTGQEVITHTLRNAIEHDRLHHAYVFSGARGVGKTTTARLLAKSLNCHKTPGPNLTPCSTLIGDMCPSCLEISESRSMDVMEFDAASNTQVEKIRDMVLEGINFRPARDRYKVFIIDEFHMLSGSSFNALLKTLEEPPDDVVFVMATTELHKVPDTILSRCQEFQFRTIPLQKIFDRLRLIADAEKIDITDDALREISRSGEGSMRDAQSNFDQVISFSGDKITSADVTNALGFAGVDILLRVVKSLAVRDPREMLNVVDDLTVRGHDLRNFCRDLLGVFRDMLVFKVSGNDEKLFENAVIGVSEMRELSAKFTEADLLRFFNSLAETETKLKEASHSRYVLEIALVKLVEMRRVEAIETLLKKLDALETGTTTAEAATAEKKTLTVESVAPEPVIFRPEPPQPPIEENIEPLPQFSDEPPEEPPFEILFEPRSVEIAPEPRPARSVAIPDLSSMPVRLPPIPSEDLEHVEDKVLDGAFEDKFGFAGDDLVPLSTAATLVHDLLGNLAESSRSTPTMALNGSSAGATSAAAAPAYETRGIVPDEVVDDDIELPVLGPDPTEEEMFAYAGAHPVVRRALRIFRGRIVKVEKNVR